MKKIIRQMLNQAGYDIQKKNMPLDLTLYDGYPEESLKLKRFYNIGAGLFYHPYWTNIDYGTEDYAVLQKHPFINYDLMALSPLPIENGIAEIVYSSHTIEHVSDEAVLNMLSEAYRILKTGGGIRLTTPDDALEYSAYKRGDIKFWDWIDWYSRPGNWEKIYTIPLSKASIHQLFLHHFASQLSAIDVDITPPKKFGDTEIEEIFAKLPMGEAFDFFYPTMQI